MNTIALNVRPRHAYAPRMDARPRHAYTPRMDSANRDYTHRIKEDITKYQQKVKHGHVLNQDAFANCIQEMFNDCMGRHVLVDPDASYAIQLHVEAFIMDLARDAYNLTELRNRHATTRNPTLTSNDLEYIYSIKDYPEVMGKGLHPRVDCRH